MEPAIRKFTVKEYAQREQVTPRTVWRWVQKGAVHVHRTPGGSVRIIESRGVVVLTPTSAR